ncbi:MAG: hypothetical protein RL011_1456 [Pseudomonadota bacterium]
MSVRLVELQPIKFYLFFLGFTVAGISLAPPQLYQLLTGSTVLPETSVKVFQFLLSVLLVPIAVFLEAYIFYYTIWAIKAYQQQQASRLAAYARFASNW